MLQNKYPCTQAELYAVARTGWNSYLEFLTSFSALRGYYLATYATTALTDIDTAEAMPNEQARYAQVEVLRTQLTTLADQCLHHWQILKRYINTSFPEPSIKARTEEAGGNYYPKAANYNWEILRLLNVQAANFLTTHNAALSAGNNMPALFPTTYTTAATDYATKMQEFLDAEEIAQLDTQNKIIANNAIYDKLITMFKDGQEIFQDDLAIRRQFIFTEVLYLISGAGISGLRGVITQEGTTQPIPNVTITVVENGKNNTTNQEGKYRLAPLAAGTYTLIIEATAYQPKTVTGLEVTTGTVSTHNFTLLPLI